MKITATLQSILMICIGLTGCGGSQNNVTQSDVLIAPPPVINNTITLTGGRNNFTITRKQNNTTLNDAIGNEGLSDVSNASTLVFSDLRVNLGIANQLQKVSKAQTQALIELYVAYFNRIPDSEGLAYWMDQLINGKSISQIADSFYQAGLLYPDLTGYSKDMSNADFVRIVYKNVLGRSGSTAPSDAEVTYWTSDIASGRQTRTSLVIAMLASARSLANDPSVGWVNTLLNNKIQVAQFFAVAQGISYSNPSDNITRTIAIANAITPNDTTRAISLIGIKDLTFDLSMTAPESPRNITSTNTSSSISFSFDGPLSDGGSPILEYSASCSSGTSTLNVKGTTSPLVIGSLSANQSYLCSLTASNSFGQSSPSTTLNVVTGTGIASPPYSGDIVLGAPTDSSVRIKLLSSSQAGFVSINYGTSPNALSNQTPTKALLAGVPLEFQLDNLIANTSIYYMVNYQSTATNTATSSKIYDFHTSRSFGDTFSFTIQADSHLDENSNLSQYQRTLDNILLDKPDFHIDLGDTFMTEKHMGPFDAVVAMATSQSMVNDRYVYERQHFGRITHSTPLFLANGNHEGELGWLYNGSANNIAVWASLARQKYYANPLPNKFYSGDPELNQLTGQRASWYAWQWGDALFIVLDPYWNTKAQASKDAWNMTLGSTQYQWLSDTLSKSSAKYKFVFLHNLVGGLDGQMRGGIEAASFYEWGGKNTDGSYGFDVKRPGWSMPIHKLLVNNRVTAVFHGHDHVYARQILDGVIYQEVPQPSAANNTSGANLAKEYHYDSGVIQSSSGHLKVTVSAQGVKGEYIRSWLPGSETSTRKNRQVDDTWTVTPAQ